MGEVLISVLAGLRACDEISGALRCRPPGPMARRERRAYRVVCKERTTQPAGLRAAARRGAAAGGHLLRCRFSTMAPHRLRRGALHLPARRSRRSASLISSQALTSTQRTRASLRVEVPFRDPMEDAVKVAIKAGGAGWEFGEGQDLHRPRSLSRPTPRFRRRSGRSSAVHPGTPSRCTPQVDSMSKQQCADDVQSGRPLSTKLSS